MRYARWRFEGDNDVATNLGLAYQLPMRRASLQFDFGTSNTSGCDDCRFYMAGVQYLRSLKVLSLGAEGDTAAASVEIALQPSLGFGAPGEGAGTVASLAVQVPFTFVFPLKGRGAIAPYFSLGHGAGLFSANGSSIGGSRTMLGAGVGYLTAGGRIQVSVGMRRIDLVQLAPSVYGLALKYGF